MTATPTAPRTGGGADGRGPAGGADAGSPAPRPAGLLRAELRRLWARRFVRVVLFVAVVGFLAGNAIAATQFARPTPEALAQAETAMAAAIEESDQYREECLAEAVPDGEEPDMFCGPPASEQGFELAWFLDKPAFVLADNLPSGATAIAVVTAAVLFIVAATYIGAEWSTRSMVALLFWEPRRLRVMAVKAAVVAGVAVLLGVVSQAAWTGAAVLLARSRGSADTVDGFWGNLLAQQGRSIIFVVVVALLGFGLAHLLRNTGAALGVGFAYFIVVETAVRFTWPSAQAFLVTDNALALLTPGGWRIYVSESFDDVGREILLSNARGGLTLVVYAAMLLAVGTWAFRRRDLH